MEKNDPEATEDGLEPGQWRKKEEQGGVLEYPGWSLEIQHWIQGTIKGGCLNTFMLKRS